MLAGRTRTFLILLLNLVFISGSLEYKSYAASEPELKAKSAIVYCENTGDTVYSVDPAKKYQPYGLNKLVTALVAVMNVPIDKKVTVSAEAASKKDPDIGLVAGEKVTVEDLLYGTLLGSGDDAAYALSEAVTKDRKDFISRMNAIASDIDCKNTRFTSVTGVSEKVNVTTCEDFIKIAKVAFKNETIKNIAAKKSYFMKPTNKSKERTITSSISDLTGDHGIYAGAYGNNGDVSTAAFAHRKDGLDLYVVLLGDTEAGRIEDAEALVRYAKDVVDGVLAVKADEKVGIVRIKGGSKTKLDVFAESDGYAYIPREGSKSLVKTVCEIDDDVVAPVNDGRKVGTCRIMVGSEKVNEVPLIIHESVGKGYFTSYLGIPDNVAIVMGIVLICVAVILLIILSLRTFNKIKLKRKKKRRVRELAEQEMREEEERNKRGWNM